jgi:xanthine dehydrogenase accessory factor
LEEGESAVTEHVFHVAIEILQGGEKAAMSTLISSKGALPTSEQSKMLGTSEGTIIGTVGGGRLEVAIWIEARHVIATGKSSLKQFSLSEAHAGAPGQPCGDIVEILTEPLPVQGEAIFRAILGLKDMGHRGMLTTILTDHPLYPEGQRKFLLCDDGSTIGSLGEVTLEEWLAVLSQVLLEREQCALETYETVDGRHGRIFLEPILPVPAG